MNPLFAYVLLVMIQPNTTMSLPFTDAEACIETRDELRRAPDVISAECRPIDGQVWPARWGK